MRSAFVPSSLEFSSTLSTVKTPPGSIRAFVQALKVCWMLMAWAVLFGLTPVNSCASVIWDESVDGDLQSGFPGTDLGFLGPGTWAILATLDGGGPGTFGGADEFDTIQFTTPGAWTFDTVSLSLESSAGFVVFVSRPIDDYAAGVWMTSPTTDVLGVLPAGSYRLEFIPGENAGKLGYTGRINVVPEPTAIALFGLGSLAVLAVRRRR